MDSMRRWLTTMPLSTGGHHNNLHYIQDFALLLAHADCVPNSRVLELGCGSGWAAEWLARLGFKVTALDINADMLEFGRERMAACKRAFPETPMSVDFVTGDAEELDFDDETFDAVFCLNSMHHIPDIPKALTEIHRVLKKGGRFLFFEPGEGHAEAEVSKREMEEHGVTEKDIIIDDIEAWARQAGFVQFGLVPSLEPITSISYGRWRDLSRAGWRLPMELWRWRKALIHRVVHHPCGYLLKGGGSARGHVVAGEIVSFSVPESVPHREMLRIKATVRNSGDTPWMSWGSFLASDPLNQGEGGYVNLGIKLMRPDGTCADPDLSRGMLLADVMPGDTAEITCLAKAPAEPGEYGLKVDLVQEGVAWFEDMGSTPLHRKLTVTSDEPASPPDTRIPDSLLAGLSMVRAEAGTDGAATVRVSVSNEGNTLWLHEPKDEPGLPSLQRGFVRLGAQVLASSGEMINRDFMRVDLPSEMAPGDTIELTATIDTSALPEDAGRLKLDMVDEQIVWFEDRGSTPLVLPLPLGLEEV
ncbi:MAG: methyltransferase domain-containing protein [Kiritimatiellia bacterium]|nr:methyltransferase domain-containing protein [Kiritimatiellia bacterium]